MQEFNEPYSNPYKLDDQSQLVDGLAQFLNMIPVWVWPVVLVIIVLIALFFWPVGSDSIGGIIIDRITMRSSGKKKGKYGKK